MLSFALRLSQGWQLSRSCSQQQSRCSLSGPGWEDLTILSSNMGRTLAVPTPYGCIGCKLPQPDYPPALIVFMFCAMVITIVVDLIGNSMVILAVSKNKKLRNSGKTPFLLPTHGAATCNP